MIRATTILFLLALSVAATPAQMPAARFEAGECLVPTNGWPDAVRVECGHLIVPESRARAKGPSVRLPVAIFRAQSPDGPPLVMLHGGPGGNGGLQSTVQQVARWPLAGRRDIVIYDQRGAGLSEPRVCPDIAERNALPLPERVRTFVTDCVARLRAAGRDPGAYGTYDNAADAIDLRKALSYTAWDVYGVSYGSRLAQELMRQDAKAIRAVVLTGVVPPGPRPYVEVRLHVQAAFDRVFARCAQQPPCAQAFPTLEQDFHETFDALTRAPMAVQVPGAVSPAHLDGVRFVEALHRHLNTPNLLPRIPLLIRELHHGDRERAAQLLMTGSERNSGVDPTGLLVSIIDVCGSNTLKRDASTVAGRVRSPFRELRTLSDIVEGCEPWRDGVAESASFAPIASDIPALIVSAEFDDRTPAVYGQAVATSLRRAFQFEVPREAHGQLTPGCHTAIVVQFLENPLRRPDGACLQTAAAIPFDTTGLGNLLKFTFRITAQGASGRGFRG
jgi:pimeloyl-ACP methyl ester carboxylesterase